MAEKLCELKKKSGSNHQVINIMIYRGINDIIQYSASTLTFHAENSYNSSGPTTTYPAQWYIAVSNDLSTWTTLFEHNHTTKTNYNTDVSVNISGYKYLRFGSGSETTNYQNVAKYNNITFT